MLSELCIRRPVMTILMMVSFLVAGLFALRQLPVAAIPRVDFPTISVSATLPGASPETMAASVASVLERQFSTIAGISSMTSTSTLGNVSIVLQFDLNRSIDGAALDVQSALSAAQRRLPQDCRRRQASGRSIRPIFRLFSSRCPLRRCLCRWSTIMPATTSSSVCRNCPALPRCWYSAARNTRCASAPTSTSSLCAA